MARRLSRATAFLRDAAPCGESAGLCIFRSAPRTF
jgi:hypothetical protein